MADFFQNLPDGWTIYLWLVVAALILVGAGIALRWAAKNEQFDEDIKYVVFDEKDKDKMEPEEYEYMLKIQKEQEQKRKDVLREKLEAKARKK